MAQTSRCWHLPATAFATIVALACTGQHAFAQQTPDAGSILRQAEPPRTPAIPRPSAPTPSPITTPRAVATGPTLQLTHILFEGNQRFSEAELAPVVAGYLNRSITLADLEVAAALVAQHYRTTGWLARVIVPPQQVGHGTVRLKVIEARLGDARFSADTDQASLTVSAAELREWVLASQAVGQLVYLPGLERGLLLANDLPGIELKGSQVAGASEGETDVLLTASNGARVYGDAGIDNMGSHSTGAARFVARVGGNSLLGRGDQFDLQTQLSEGIRYGRVAGSLPIGRQGLRAGLNLSMVDYRVTSSRFSALRSEGHSRNLGADLSYPIVRAADRNLYLGASFESKDFHNRTIAGVASDYGIRNLVLKLDGNFFDGLGGSGINTATVSLVHGNADLDGSPSKAADAATVNTHGHFRLLRYRIARNQTLGPALTLVTTFSGQQANRNLDSSEKFYLGGPHGVRAYPLNEGGGSQGQLLNLDLRWRVSACDCTALAFYDWGHVRVNVRNGFAGAPALNGYDLKGFGVGVSGAIAKSVNYSLVLARRIGRNPNAAPNGDDQDGTLRRTRVWASASVVF